MWPKLRRSRRRALLALTLALATVAAACADDDDDTGVASETSAAAETTAAPTSAAAATTAPSGSATTSAIVTGTTAAPATEPFDPEGVLRYSADISNQTEPAFDPIRSISQTNQAYLGMLYDTLLRKQPDGSFVPALAEDVTQVDAQTLEVRIRAGAQFTDGTPVDAEAARFSLLRVRDTTNPAAFTAEYALLADVVVVDDLTFRIVLAQPAAAAYTPLLAGPETMIVSRTAVEGGTDINTTPVGAGPFVLDSYEPGVGITFTKNPDYWDADNIKLAGVEVVHIPAGPQNQTALRAGQVDMIGITPADIPALEGDYGISRRASPDSYMWMPICKTQAPFDDVRVRQALNYAIDKDALNQGVLQGTGEPMHAMFPADDALFPDALADSYAYDPDRARQLLQEAGVAEGTEVGLITIAGSPAVERFAEIVQQAWSDVGVELRIVPSQNITEDFYQNVREPLFILPTSRGGVSKVTNQYVGPQLGNVCRWDDPELAALTTELASTAADDPKAVQLWAQVQQIVFDDALEHLRSVQPDHLGVRRIEARRGGRRHRHHPVPVLLLDLREALTGLSTGVELGVFVAPQQGATYDDLLRVAGAAERLGFHAFVRSDHYLTVTDVIAPPGPSDAWITLAALARETSTIRLGTLVSPVTFRPPTVLALTVAQVDAMSAGRVILGLGAGWHEREHTAYGLAFPPVAERFERLEEQLAIVTGLWTTPADERFTFRGRHHVVDALPALPRPVQRPHPPIVVGGSGRHRTPSLAARYAQEFNVPPMHTPAETAALFDRVRAACAAHGRAARDARDLGDGDGVLRGRRGRARGPAGAPARRGADRGRERDARRRHRAAPRLRRGRRPPDLPPPAGPPRPGPRGAAGNRGPPAARARRAGGARADVHRPAPPRVDPADAGRVVPRVLAGDVPPGDPATTIAGGSDATPEQIDEVRDSSASTTRPSCSTWRWLRACCTSTSVTSLFNERSVPGELGRRFPITFSVAVGAIAVSLVLGVGAGVLAGTRPGPVTDRAVDHRHQLRARHPELLAGAVLVIVFAVKLQWLPAIGVHQLRRGSRRVGQAPRHAVDRPRASALAATLARQVRGALIDVLEPGLHPHRPGQGPPRARRDRQARAARTRPCRRSRCSASSSPTCSAARSSSSRSSRSPGLGRT